MSLRIFFSTSFCLIHSLSCFTQEIPETDNWQEPIVGTELEQTTIELWFTGTQTTYKLSDWFIVINNQQELDAFQEKFEYDITPENIDFATSTIILVSRDNLFGCRSIIENTNKIVYEGNNEFIYHLHLTIDGLCYAAKTWRNHIIVPKIPEWAEVKFDYKLEYIED